jgi:hypothetical protein
MVLGRSWGVWGVALLCGAALLGCNRRGPAEERVPSNAKEAVWAWTGARSELLGPEDARELRLRRRRASLKVLDADLAPLGVVREVGAELWLDGPDGQRRFVVGRAQAPTGAEGLGLFVALPQDKPKEQGPDLAKRAPDAPSEPAPSPAAQPEDASLPQGERGEALAWVVEGAQGEPRLRLLSKDGAPWLELQEGESGWVAKDKRAGVTWLLKRDGRRVAAWSGAQAEPLKVLEGGRWEVGACAPGLLGGWDELAPGSGGLLQAGVMLAFDGALRRQAP